jgi:hypothetical protein
LARWNHLIEIPLKKKECKRRGNTNMIQTCTTPTTNYFKQTKTTLLARVGLLRGDGHPDGCEFTSHPTQCCGMRRGTHPDLERFNLDRPPTGFFSTGEIAYPVMVKLDLGPGLAAEATQTRVASSLPCRSHSDVRSINSTDQRSKLTFYKCNGEVVLDTLRLKRGFTSRRQRQLQLECWRPPPAATPRPPAAAVGVGRQ